MPKQTLLPKTEARNSSTSPKAKSLLRRKGRPSQKGAFQPKAIEDVNHLLGGRRPVIEEGTPRSKEDGLRRRNRRADQKSPAAIVRAGKYQAGKKRHLRNQAGHGEPGERLPSKKLQPELTQEKINAWMERYRRDRSSPRIQAHLAKLTAKWWRGRQVSANHVMQSW